MNLGLGILIPEFPTQTHVFFWRELQALRGLGVDARVLSTRRPREDCPHPFAAEARGQTYYLFPPSAGSALTGLRPRTLGNAIMYLNRMSGSKARGLVLLGAAADLVGHSRRSGIDHVHVHSCADAAHVAALAHQLGGPSYSLHLHGDLEVYGVDHALKMRNASFVSAAARPMQQQLIARVGLPPARTCTLWMGVDTDLFIPAPPRIGTGELRLLTVARLKNTKGHRHALAAVRMLLDRGLAVTYWIAGSGPDRGLIEDATRQLGLGDQVKLLGSVDEQGVLELLRASDVFILPSYGAGEASPVAVMEAMACGLPVVSSIIGGTPDMISDEVDGFLVPQQDEAAIANAVERLYRDPKLRSRIGAAARERAVEAFDYRKRARDFLEVLLSSASLWTVARQHLAEH